MSNNTDELRVELPSDNYESRVACVLLLDTSGSMSGSPINELNNGLKSFQEAIMKDELASLRVDLAIVTFGNGGVQLYHDFSSISDYNDFSLQSGGDTPMGEAIRKAVQMVADRKAYYKSTSITYYRPWIFMITDGGPTDNWQDVPALIRAEESESRKKFAFFAVGVQGANMNTLGQISVRPPEMLDGLNFQKLFKWLSDSLIRVSSSTPGDQVPLAEATWKAI